MISTRYGSVLRQSSLYHGLYKPLDRLVARGRLINLVPDRVEASGNIRHWNDARLNGSGDLSLRVSNLPQAIDYRFAHKLASPELKYLQHAACYHVANIASLIPANEVL